MQRLQFYRRPERQGLELVDAFPVATPGQLECLHELAPQPVPGLPLIREHVRKVPPLPVFPFVDDQLPGGATSDAAHPLRLVLQPVTVGVFHSRLAQRVVFQPHLWPLVAWKALQDLGTLRSRYPSATGFVGDRSNCAIASLSVRLLLIMAGGLSPVPRARLPRVVVATAHTGTRVRSVPCPQVVVELRARVDSSGSRRRSACRRILMTYGS